MVEGLIGSVLGSVASGLFGSSSAKQQQKASERAYKHRYQWEMEDLRKAGLNPMLAISQGAPGPAHMAQADAPDVGSHIASAAQAALTRSTAKSLNATAKAEDARAQKLTQETVGQHYDNIIKMMETEGLTPERAQTARYGSPIGRLGQDISSAKQSFSRWLEGLKKPKVIRRPGGGYGTGGKW